MKSTEFLQSAIDVQAERGATYDKPTGERSMGATVTAFNAITGRDLSEAEGWLLLQTLKDVRQWQNPSKYHHDSALDGVAYSALKAEALSEDQVSEPSHIISDIPSDVKDRQQWKIGDIFEVTSSGYEFDAGEHVRLINDMTKERSPCCEYLDGRDHWWVNEDSLKFISRPTSTAK